MKNGIIKFRELKKGIRYAIPCKRKNGEEDFATIVVQYDERYKQDTIFVGNRFMGACLEKVRDDSNWFKIV